MDGYFVQVTELQGPVRQILPVFRAYDVATDTLNVVLDGRRVGLLRLDKALLSKSKDCGFESHRGRHPTKLN